MAVTAGIRLPVAHADVFPHGCHLVPDSITEAQGWDEVSRTRTPALDKLTGQHVYQVRVIDLDLHRDLRVVWPPGRPLTGPARDLVALSTRDLVALSTRDLVALSSR